MSLKDYLKRFTAPAPEPGIRAAVEEIINPPIIDKKTALRINTVYACINIISNAVASLPFDLYARTASGRKKAVEHKLYRLSKYPSVDVPAFNYMEALMVNLLIYGNAYVELVRLASGRVAELHLIPSSAVSMVHKNDGEIIYTVTEASGSKTISSRDGRIMHITGKSFNGREGLSPVDLALKSIKLSEALENFGLQYFERGARPAGFLKVPHKMSDKAAINLKRSFMESYMGSRNSGKTIILEDGVEYEAAQNGNDSSQFIESRRYQIAEIARIFNISLVFLQETEKSTSWGSGIEQLNIMFYQNCLLSWLKRIEAAYNFTLLNDRERDIYYFEFNNEGLLRGDLKSRYEAYHTAIMDGWLSPAEVREKENLPAEPGQGQYFMPVNMEAYAGPDMPPADNTEVSNND